jgi:hypothetical protein
MLQGITLSNSGHNDVWNSHGVPSNGNPAPVTMNGIPIDISDIKVRSVLNKMTNYPPDVTMEALQII